MSLLQSYNCQVVDLLHPQPSDYNLDEIANSLSKLCRFTGQILPLYTVAQHSVLCARMAQEDPRCDKDDVKWALLHDASESFLGDVSSPVKALLPEYRRIENLHMAAVARRFGLAEGIPPVVKEIDRRMTVTERNRFYCEITEVWDDWKCVDPFFNLEITIWGHLFAYSEFWGMAKRLGVENVS